jgi:hypothetical protein
VYKANGQNGQQLAGRGGSEKEEGRKEGRKERFSMIQKFAALVDSRCLKRQASLAFQKLATFMQRLPPPACHSTRDTRSASPSKNGRSGGTNMVVSEVVTQTKAWGKQSHLCRKPLSPLRLSPFARGGWLGTFTISMWSTTCSTLT